MELRTVKGVGSQHFCGQSRRSITHVSEADAILVWSLGELFDLAKFDVQRQEECPGSVHLTVVEDIPCSARHYFLQYRPVLV